MSALEASIDDLYRLPLAEFTGARNALAKTLTGPDAKRVRALTKPTVVPWAVNQVYWRARSTYDRLMKSGERLRAAQIAALEGRAADVRAAGDAHRRAIADAVAEAGRLAAPAGAKPGADELARTFEAMSLASKAPEPPGRLTEAPQPAGFEALAGIGNLEVRTEKLELKTANAERRTTNDERRTNDEPRTNHERQARAQASAAAKAAAKEAARAAEEAARAAAARKQHESAVKEAEAQVARAEMTERASRDTWERAHDALLAARQALADVKRKRPA